MDQRRGQVEAALHAPGVGVDLAVDGGADVDQGEDLGHAGQAFVAAEPVETGLEVEELPARLAVVESGVLEGDADLEADELGMAGHVVAGDESPAPRRAQQGAEHADERRLAGAVRAEEPVDLARGDGEVDAVDGPVVAELASDVLGDDGRAVHGRRGYRAGQTPPDARHGDGPKRAARRPTGPVGPGKAVGSAS